MDRENRKKSTEIAAAADKLPELNRAELSGAALAKITESVRKDLGKIKEGRPVLRRITSIAGYAVMAGGAAGAVTVGGPLFVLLAAAGLASTVLMGASHDIRLNNSYYSAKAILNGARNIITRTVKREQINKFEEKRNSLIALTEAHLAKNGLIDEKTLSYLVAFEPESLKGASDQLAITVLQARGLIHFLLQANLGAEDGPMTFARFARDFQIAVNPFVPGHRKMLRQYLEKTDKGIGGIDLSPIFEAVALPAPAAELRKLEIASDASLGNMFRLPFTGMKDTANLRKVKNTEISGTFAVPVPPLPCLEDFAERLARYEKMHGALDLPALRGWKMLPRALPKQPILKPLSE